jgi:hypothetical protein
MISPAAVGSKPMLGGARRLLDTAVDETQQGRRE